MFYVLPVGWSSTQVFKNVKKKQLYMDYNWSLSNIDSVCFPHMSDYEGLPIL